MACVANSHIHEGVSIQYWTVHTHAQDIICRGTQKIWRDYDEARGHSKAGELSGRSQTGSEETLEHEREGGIQTG